MIYLTIAGLIEAGSASCRVISRSLVTPLPPCPGGGVGKERTADLELLLPSCQRPDETLRRALVLPTLWGRTDDRSL